MNFVQPNGGVNTPALGNQAVVGLFQTFTVRAPCFLIISIVPLTPSYQYLAVLPVRASRLDNDRRRSISQVVITIRSANVSVPPLTPPSLIPNIAIRHSNKERSFGVFEIGPKDEDRREGIRPERAGQDFHQYLRRQVALISGGGNSSCFYDLLTESATIVLVFIAYRGRMEVPCPVAQSFSDQ